MLAARLALVVAIQRQAEGANHAVAGDAIIAGAMIESNRSTGLNNGHALSALVRAQQSRIEISTAQWIRSPLLIGDQALFFLPLCRCAGRYGPAPFSLQANLQI